jgi:hypothetical protein
MQTYDLTLKDLLMDGAPVLLRQVARLDGLRLAPLEVPVVGGGRLDLFGDIDGETALHTEIQADNDAAMGVRMLGYFWLVLRQRPKVKVRQLVLYVGRAPMTMPNRIDGPGLAFHFDLIDARLLQSDALLASDHPCDIIMAFFAATDDIKARVRAVVNRLAARLADDPPRLRDALVRLTLLAPLRRAEPIVLEEICSMPITIDLETHPFASKFFLKGRSEGKAEGRTEGKAEGKADTLLRQIRRRFKTLPADLEARVHAATGEQLDDWLDRFVDATTLGDIFSD